MNNDDAARMNGHERNYYSIQGMMRALDNVGAPAQREAPVMEAVAPIQAPAQDMQAPAPEQVPVQESAEAAESSGVDPMIDSMEQIISDYRRGPLNPGLMNSSQKQDYIFKLQEKLAAVCRLYITQWDHEWR